MNAIRFVLCCTQAATSYYCNQKRQDKCHFVKFEKKIKNKNKTKTYSIYDVINGGLDV